MRIISLVPSITELLYDLGLDEEVVGITKFCIHPAHWLKTKTIIGGTKNLRIDTIKALAPSLIIANKEENVKEQIEALTATCPILLTDVNDYDEALEMIKDVGHATNKEQEAEALILLIRKSNMQKKVMHTFASALYLIWKQPYMAVGGDSFIHSMMTQAGFTNVLGHKARYPLVTLDEIEALHPEYILISTEPYPFGDEDKEYFATQFPNSKVLIVDGTYFSWYGSRMVAAGTYFGTLLPDKK